MSHRMCCTWRSVVPQTACELSGNVDFLPTWGTYNLDTISPLLAPSFSLYPPLSLFSHPQDTFLWLKGPTLMSLPYPLPPREQISLCSQKCWVLLFAVYTEICWGCKLSPNICSLEWSWRGGKDRTGVRVVERSSARMCYVWALCVCVCVYNYSNKCFVSLLSALLAAPRKQNIYLCNCTQSVHSHRQVHFISTFLMRKLFASQMCARDRSKRLLVHESPCKWRKTVKSDKQKNYNKKRRRVFKWSMVGTTTELSVSVSH